MRTFSETNVLLLVSSVIDSNIFVSCTNRYYPGNGRVVLHVWFSPPEFMQEVLAMPEKSEYIIDALLGPLAAPQKSALVAAAEHGSIKGWAGSYGNADATTAPGKSGWPLVCDLRKSKDIPRARWADELDFCTCSCVDYELYHFTRCALYYLSCVWLRLLAVQPRSEWTE